MVYSIRLISTTGCGITSKKHKTPRSKKIVVGVGIVALVITICAFLIPPTYQYSKEAEIVAQDRMVFVFMGDLKRWVEWSPWAAKDPKMENTYSDPAWGVGSTYTWNSSKMGRGEAKVSQFVPVNTVAYDVSIAGFEPSKWELRMRPALRQGVVVTWSVNGKYPDNRFMRLIAYLMMWGLPAEMQDGVTRLKKLAESHEAYDVLGDWEKPKAPPPEAPKPEIKPSKPVKKEKKKT